MSVPSSKIFLSATLTTVVLIAVFLLYTVKQFEASDHLQTRIIHAQNILVTTNEIEDIYHQINRIRKDNPSALKKSPTSTQGELPHELLQKAQLLLSLNINNSLENKQIDSLAGYIESFIKAIPTSAQNPWWLNHETLPAEQNIQTGLPLLKKNIQHQLEEITEEAAQNTAYSKPLIYILVILLLLSIILILQQGFAHIKTEKKAAAEIVYNSMLTEQVEDAIIRTDKTFRIASFNGKAQQLFGWKPEDIKGKSIVQALKLGINKPEGALILKKIVEEGLWEGNLAMHKNGGEQVTLQACATLLKKDNEKRGELLLIVRNTDTPKELAHSSSLPPDVSLNKMLEDRTSEIRLVLERLVASEKKYKLLFDYSPLPMWMISLSDMQITDVNDAAIKQLGYTRRMFLQMQITQTVLPEEENLLESTLKSTRQGYRAIGTWRQFARGDKVIHAELFTYHTRLDDQPMCLILSNDITDKLIAEEKIKQSLDAIRLLSSHLQHVREEERKSIARNIHDELGQHLTVIKMDISWINRRIRNQEKEITDRLKKMLETIDITIKFVRSLCSELRPSVLDDMGLLAAMEWHAQKFESNAGIKVILDTPAQHLNITDEAQTALFRIFQEALTNVARYSKATKVNTTVAISNETIEMWVTDNGIGFEPDTVRKTQTLGILGMRERCMMLGGNFDIKSKTGTGTTVYACIPTTQKNIDNTLLVNEIQNYKITRTN